MKIRGITFFHPSTEFVLEFFFSFEIQILEFFLDLLLALNLLLAINKQASKSVIMHHLPAMNTSEYPLHMRDSAPK
jgi:hypothetical protein